VPIATIDSEFVIACDYCGEVIEGSDVRKSMAAFPHGQWRPRRRTRRGDSEWAERRVVLFAHKGECLDRIEREAGRALFGTDELITFLEEFSEWARLRAEEDGAP
jgi:hypothetical protein